MTYYLSWAIKLLQTTFPYVHAFEQLPIIPLINKIIDYVNYSHYKKKIRNQNLTGNRIPLHLVITHLCNKKCLLCANRIQTSSYKYLTKEEYEYLVSCIQNPQEITSILLSGGEPLCHPFFPWLVDRMTTDFPNARIMVLTNGKLLPTLEKRVFERISFTVSHYPTWNDDIIKQYCKYPNVFIKRYQGFWNVYRDPDLDENTAKEIRKRCHYNIYIIGTKLYNCCNAEGVERVCQTDPVHVQFNTNWQENLPNLPTWKACQHCYIAMNFFIYKERDAITPRIFKHQQKANRYF